MVINLNDSFKRYFPALSEQFSLKEFQKLAVHTILRGHRTLCIMPTGGGKSLIYWLAGLQLDGVTVVVSPLTALIDEQASKIEKQGYSVLTIHAGLDGLKQAEILRKLHRRELNPNFIFVSPERMATDGFFEFCLRERKDDVKLIVIDEIHCVSQWGFSFRPFYKRIPEFLTRVFSVEWPRFLGLTATLNPHEVGDICEAFNIPKASILKDDLLIRSEIELKVQQFVTEEEKEDKLWQLLEIHKGEKVLVYLYRKRNKRGTEDLRDKALEKGFKASNFHGDMSSLERQEIIQAFKNGDLDVVFATNAFGMGIDIPDIRVVIHFMIPESVEQYYQEVGRASRDGEASNAYVLYTNKNIQVKKTHFIDNSFPTVDELKDVHSKITGGILGLRTLQYFENEDVQRCFPYYLDQGILSIRGKAFTNLDVFSKIQSNSLQQLYGLTKNKGTITTLKKSGMEPGDLSSLTYAAVANGEARLSKGFDKCLVIENHYEQIPESTLEKLAEDINEKKHYKHGLLDYFTYLLDNTTTSTELHQEIGLYLGVDKHKAGRIHSTHKGDLVRSKSEVIIANLLFSNRISYEYEKKLVYASNKWIEPDFTISLSGEEVYLEHLGMLGSSSYDERWIKKLNIYNEHFPEQLFTTYEGTTITDQVLSLINNWTRNSDRH
ncbi:RecQ family ATP-dependent DNA helicase [Alicyclobacillus sp. ALC3]|uniref:RecQ family ATP-dependent DNA helicase n=1 Tax=Alicyclobacillus sp. ALC3 TaxID=2796143 RepID=UPI00237967C1|nr:RecQ family ATP-dependent DNA helicase [Alicyclobacillus sp. ALC3]WDL98476.1 ATP-dependent DNA helicase RecQ [Alicyclobacillus sp. ALC3]